MNTIKLDAVTISNRYRVKGKIGLGGHAEVFVANDLKNNDELVVIKALNCELNGTVEIDLEQTLIENFHTEAEILRSLSHSNIVSIIDEGKETDGTGKEFSFLVIEYLQGGDLMRFTRSQPDYCLSIEQSLDYTQQICNGLGFAHDHGIIHRDLKPNNFLLTADFETVKIADFGVAKIGGDQFGQITRVGTNAYSAPEHSPNESPSTIGKLTASADVYSLAKSCYTIICGRSPSEFAGNPISELPPTIKEYPWSEKLLEVLRRATANNVESRYRSASEFWDDLSKIRTNLPKSSTPYESTRLSPEDKELAKKKREVEPLESILAQKELDLVTFQLELKEFETGYLNVVGICYTRLDEIIAQIAETKAELYPDDEELKEKAEEARVQADESESSTAQSEKSETKGRFKPSVSLKNLYREVARCLHPDLVLDPDEKMKRNDLLAKANQAYEDGDQEALENILDEWQRRPESVEGDDTGSEWVRVVRRIAQIESRLKTIEKEWIDLEKSEIFELKSKVAEAEIEGRDLLDEMAMQIEDQIKDAKDRLEEIEMTKVRSR